MADEGLTVEVTNQAAFDGMLDQIRRDLDDLRGPLEAGARELSSAAQAAAPRKSGHLAASHRVLPAAEKQVRLTVDTPYAAVIHWGWPGHGISRKPWLVATWLRNPAPLAKMTDAVQADIDKAATKT